MQLFSGIVHSCPRQKQSFDNFTASLISKQQRKVRKEIRTCKRASRLQVERAGIIVYAY